MNTKTLPAKLRRWRRKRKLSQSEAAKKLGVTVASIQNWEQAISVPSSLALSALLKVISN